MAAVRFFASGVLALAIMLLLSPRVQAATLDYTPPAGTRGWCTPVGPGQSACFGSPAAACQAQWEVYGEPFLPNSGPLKGYKDTSNWSAKECDWDYNASPAPTIVLFQCDFPSTAVAPGRCVNGWNNFRQCADPCANFGSHPAPATPGPIDLFSGSKVLDATDFENETSTLAVRRHFGSMSWSGSPTGMLRPPASAGNWRFGFSVELQLTNAISSGIVSVLLPDGSLLAFIKQTDGSLAPYVTNAYPVPRTDYRLTLSGAWPTAPGDLKLSPSTWTLTGPEAVWTLSTKRDPVRGQYVVGTPDTMAARQGPTWSFAYGSAGELETLTDQFGNRITLDWIMSTAGAAHPMAVSEIGLPGGRRLRYGSEDSEGGALSPDRLVTVEWLSSTNVVEDRTRYVYADNRHPLLITEIRDSEDVGRWFVAYQNDGKAVSSAAALGAQQHTVSYASGAGTHTRVVTGPLGRQTTYTWSAGGYPFNSNLRSISQAASPNAPASTEAFASSGFQMTSTTDAEGRITRYVRDAAGRPTLISEADGTPLERRTTINWHPTFNKPVQIAIPGLTAAFTYDLAGRATSRTLTDTTTITVPYATNGRSRTWTYDWSALGLLEAIDGPLPGTADTVAFGYNAQGYLTSVTNEVGHVTTVTATDWRGAPLTVEDENGTDTVLTYDIRGRPTSVTVNPGPDQSAYLMTYDAGGNLSRLTLPEGGWLSYTYDAANRLTRTENDRGETLTFAVNALGQPVGQTIRDSSLAITFQQTQAYDALGRVRQMVGGGAETWSFGYDRVDNLIRTTDPRSQVWGTAWDALNRVLTETNPQAATVEFTFAPNGALTSFEDGRDLETTRIVDGFGLMIFEASPDRGEQTYWYDAAFRLTRKMDADGVESNYVYDNAGRLLSETFTGSPGDAVNYTYDSTTGGNRGIGRLTGVADPSGSSAMVYDAQGRLGLSSQTIGSHSYTLGYTYNEDGEVAAVTYPSGRIVEIERDPEGRITDIATRASAATPLAAVVSDAGYAPFGPLTGLTFANGLALSQEYDLNYWQTGLEVAAPGASRLDLAFDRDNAGALDGVTDNLSTGRDASFGYTGAGRLQYAVGAWGDHSFDYDPAGNRTELRTDTGGVVAYEFAITAPESNRIEEVRDTGWNVIRDLTWRDGGDLYQQDFTGGDTQTLLYDARKRLVELQVNAVGVASYAYDFEGRRVSATVGGDTTHYVFDVEGRLLAEHAGATGAVSREYIWLDDRPVALLVTTGGVTTTYAIHTGQIGEPLLMTDSAKAVVWNAAVTPWGEAVMLSSPTTDLDLRLVGQWLQGESGLHQNWMRDYDPTLGRYVQADPLGLDSGQNLYAYGDGDPLNAVDPTGELAFLVPVAVGMLAGAGSDIALQLLMNGGDFNCIDWGSVGVSALMGAVPGGAGARMLRKVPGLEFSHALPARWFRPRSRSYQPGLPQWIERSGLNGSRVTPRRHYRHDQFRYPRGSRDFGNRLPMPLRVADRIPDWLKISSLGGMALGGANAGGSRNCCQR